MFFGTDGLLTISFLSIVVKCWGFDLAFWHTRTPRLMNVDSSLKPSKRTREFVERFLVSGYNCTWCPNGGCYLFSPRGNVMTRSRKTKNPIRSQNASRKRNAKAKRFLKAKRLSETLFKSETLLSNWTVPLSLNRRNSWWIWIQVHVLFIDEWYFALRQVTFTIKKICVSADCWQSLSFPK